jgi:hypothetical protein
MMGQEVPEFGILTILEREFGARTGPDTAALTCDQDTSLQVSNRVQWGEEGSPNSLGVNPIYICHLGVASKIRIGVALIDHIKSDYARRTAILISQYEDDEHRFVRCIFVQGP